eukprot:TRINITY_DN7134_c0_g5_i1.p1 TRINITY_DN7134_c0_g5~~TRINITY_DN7134_c0_g5_i1.p1  ORF type:complete len:386 (-),score=85.47 TRINITY_DN7134_c0_g5_i1:161-1318(-)
MDCTWNSRRGSFVDLVGEEHHRLDDAATIENYFYTYGGYAKVEEEHEEDRGMPLHSIYHVMSSGGTAMVQQPRLRLGSFNFSEGIGNGLDVGHDYQHHQHQQQQQQQYLAESFFNFADQLLAGNAHDSPERAYVEHEQPLSEGGEPLGCIDDIKQEEDQEPPTLLKKPISKPKQRRITKRPMRDKFLLGGEGTSVKIVRQASTPARVKEEYEEKETQPIKLPAVDEKTKFLELLPEPLRRIVQPSMLEQIFKEFSSLTSYSPSRELIESFSRSGNMPSAPSRKVGALSLEERRAKVEKYLLKRKQRTWNKKISYDCRKRVADSRLRIKGRFVTREQAISMLQLSQEDFDALSPQEVKSRLAEKFGTPVVKKKPIGRPRGKSGVAV